MKAVFKSSYPKAGREIFVFTMKGSQEELDQYITDNPQAVTDEVTGAPLFFTAYPTLDYNKSGGVEVDNSEMRRAQALSTAFGATEQFNQAVVEQITGTMFSKRRVSIATVEDIAEEADLDNI
jgi:hypothetical protein